MITRKYKLRLVKCLNKIGHLLLKCGGIGSGVPGPCPSGINHAPHGTQERHSKATGHVEVMHPIKQGKDGVWRHNDGTEIPKDVAKKLKLKPQWKKDGKGGLVENPLGLKDVRINKDLKNGDCLTTGIDAKGRVQAGYSDSHNAQASAAKFGRIRELLTKLPKIEKKVDADIKAGGAKGEDAFVAKLINHTGMRPGSEKDTGAKYKSYGATTLEGRHIVQKPDGSVVAKFVPGKKKGQEIEMPIHNKELASQLLERSKKVGPDGKMFDTTAARVGKYNKQGGFKTKDSRTALGTVTAVNVIKNHPEPKNLKEYKAALVHIGTEVSKILGNTPAVALQSYIDPLVFAGWKAKVGA